MKFRNNRSFGMGYRTYRPISSTDIKKHFDIEIYFRFADKKKIDIRCTVRIKNLARK